MSVNLPAQLKRRIPWIAAAGIVGAIVFLVAQVLAGFPATIAQFIGRQIVRNGGYSESLAGVIGYGVHFGVALSYAALLGIVISFVPLPEGRGPRWVISAFIAAAFGWIASLVAAPAIAITIGILSGQGFPAQLPGLNTAFNFVFWIHMGFFAVVWLLEVATPDLLASRAGTFRSDSMASVV